MAIKKKKDVTFEFWKVRVPPNFSGGFKAVLTSLAQAGTIEQRNQIINGYTMRWEELEVTGRYFFCDFIKLRMDLLPLKGGVNTKSSSLNLPSNEGIAEPFVCLFDTHSDILVVQRNHYGASVGAFIQYVQQLVPVGGLIETLPVLSLAGLQKLTHLDDVRRVSFRIAKPRNAAYNPGASGSVDSSISTMDDFDGQSIEVVISSGFARRSLTLREVFKKANAFLTGQTTGNAELEKFEVSGYSNGSRDEFDLVKEQLRAKIDVVVGTKRDLAYADRKHAAVRALTLRRGDLITQFGQHCA